MIYYPQIDLTEYHDKEIFKQKHSKRLSGFGATLCGPLGGGKGLFAMELLDKYSRLRPCFTNIEILENAPFFKSIRRMESKEIWNLELYPRGSFLCIDEADLDYHCEDFRDLRHHALPFMKLLRKRRIAVVFICQMVGNLYKQFRDMSQRHYVVDNSMRSNPMLSTIGRYTSPRVVDWLAYFTRREFAKADYKTQTSFRMWPYRYFANKYFERPWFDTDQDVF